MGKFKQKNQDLSIKSTIQKPKKPKFKKQKPEKMSVGKKTKVLLDDAKKTTKGNKTLKEKPVVSKKTHRQTESKVKTEEKKKSKKILPKESGNDISSEMRKELEVLIKNLNREGVLQQSFVVDDETVEAAEGDDDVISVDGSCPEDDDEAEQDSLPNDAVAKESKKEQKKKKKKEKGKDLATSKEGKNEDVESKIKTETVAEAAKDRADYFFVKEHVKERSYCLMKPKEGEPWYELVENKTVDEDESGVETSQYWLMKIEKFTNKLMELEVANFSTQSSKETKKSSDKRFIETVLRSGTLSDKISAYAVMIQESPVHHLATLQNLIDMVSLKSRRPCMLALDALQNLFSKSLLVPDRKLRNFAQCPIRHLDKFSGGNKDTRDKYLVSWLFEQKLKEMYAKFLTALAEIGQDTMEATRMKVLSVTLELLCSNPEQEQELLSRLVNKLGDPVRSVAAKAVYQIGILLQRHPAMKGVVLTEIERLLYRTNISPRAQYYGICCLTQLILDDFDDEDKKIANKLITIYFSFFKVCIKKGDIDSKLVSALLTGVHRAYPFASVKGEVMQSQVDAMYKLAALSNINIAVHAFMLLFQVMGSGGESVTDRFYTAFYRKLMSPELSETSKPALFLNLIFKVVKNDPSANRARAFIKRLLQLCAYWSPHLVCSIHYLISEVLHARPELNLVNSVDESPQKFDDDDEEADDYKKDVPLSDDDGEDKSEKTDVEVATKQSVKPSWLHRSLQKSHTRTSYNSYEMNPLYAGAEKSNVWEMLNCVAHYHPSAALFSQTLLNGEKIKYSGDALSDFTLMRFLDRFVFRNPKKEPGKNKPHNVFSKRNTYQPPPGVKRLAPDSKEYTERDEKQVPLDERFIYRFFREKKSRVSDAQDSDAESVNSDDAMEAIAAFGEEAASDLDFASAFESSTSKGKRKNTSKERDGESSDESDADSLSELDEDDESDVDEIVQASDDEFEEVSDFENMEDDDFEVAPKATKKKSDQKTKNIKRLAASTAHEIFASADEFSALIDDDNEPNESIGGREQISNKDRSSAKQLNWESSRHSDFKRAKKFGKQKFKKFSGKGGGKKKH